jgi:hypothetical protein
MVPSTALPSMVVQWDNPLNLEHVGVQRELWIVAGQWPSIYDRKHNWEVCYLCYFKSNQIKSTYAFFSLLLWLPLCRYPEGSPQDSLGDSWHSFAQFRISRGPKGGLPMAAELTLLLCSKRFHVDTWWKCGEVIKGHEVPSLGMFLREVHKEGNRAQATFYLYLAIPYLLQLVSGLSSIYRPSSAFRSSLDSPGAPSSPWCLAFWRTGKETGTMLHETR